MYFVNARIKYRYPAVFRYDMAGFLLFARLFQ